MSTDNDNDEGMRLLLAYREATAQRLAARRRLVAASEKLEGLRADREVAGQNAAAAWAALENWVRSGFRPVTAIEAPDPDDHDDE